MTPTETTAISPVRPWEQRATVAGARPPRPLSKQYQDLKFTLHRKLLDKINLDALATIETQTVAQRSAPAR